MIALARVGLGKRLVKQRGGGVDRDHVRQSLRLFWQLDRRCRVCGREPSRSMNLCRPLTADSERSTDETAYPPKRRAMANASISALVTSRNSTPRRSKNATYVPKSRRYASMELTRRPRSTARWSRYSAGRPAPRPQKAEASSCTVVTLPSLSQGRPRSTAAPPYKQRNALRRITTLPSSRSHAARAIDARSYKLTEKRLRPG